MTENWKPINGYDDKYLISDLGRVISFKTNRILKPFTSRVGYNHVMLCKKGKKKNFSIHRLVGIHFLPNWNKKKCIDHKNRIRNDNRVYNLRWATFSENSLNTKYPRGSVYKDKRYNNSYTCEYFIKRKERKWKNFKTREEAEEFRKLMFLKYSTD